MSDYETYSDAKKRLEEIARQMEGKDITLEKSIELYEEGARLAAVCYDKLNSAKLRFTQITASAERNAASDGE